MNLNSQPIGQITTITHDGKVLVFGTGTAGEIFYSVKRSGFEDTAIAPEADPFGFEEWQLLRLGDAAPDASVIEDEQASLTDSNGVPILRSVYGKTSETTLVPSSTSVQLVSAMNHLYVFRQSAASGKILMNRYVLDGLTNQLLPKLDVRFRRSKQRLAPQQAATSKSGLSFDNLDYRDMNGNSFFEPALELSFAGTAGNGWFSVVLVPTDESERQRWHVFTYNSTTGKLVLYSVGCGADGLFDVKDYLFGVKDPNDPENTIYSMIPGIVQRTIDLGSATIAECPSASTYDVQKERMTDAGPQLMRDTTRVMLAVPVKPGNAAPVRTAVLDFAVARDGLLSRVDLSPDASAILRSNTREVITPLNLFDRIHEFAASAVAPSGTIIATERGAEDLLQVRCKDPLPEGVEVGAKVKIGGTQSYDGYYKVVGVEGTTFVVETVFQNNEAGAWEIVNEKQVGLVFDNMVVGTEKTVDGKLKVLCPAHDLKVGDEVQISGTVSYDGIFPVMSADAGTNGFVLDAPFFTGEVANLSKVVRRGLRMDGNDSVEAPELELRPPSPERDYGRALSAWVFVDAEGNCEQRLINDSGDMMSLGLGSDNKVKLSVRMSDGTIQSVSDLNTVPVGVWTHYAGMLDYVTATAGDTHLVLCRNGVQVAKQVVAHELPSHVGEQVIAFDGVDDGVQVLANPPDLANKSFSIELWARRNRTGTEAMLQQGAIATNTSLYLGFKSNNVFTFSFYNNDVDSPLAITDKGWHHWVGTYDATTRTQRIYQDGVLLKERVAPAHYQGSGSLNIGMRFDNTRYFQGNIADVRLWNRARKQSEIVAEMAKRMTGREAGLIGYWPLDNKTGKDLAQAKRHGVLMGNPKWGGAAYRYPQMMPPVAAGAKVAKVMKFDGYDDFVQVPPFAAPANAITVSIWARSATPTWNAYGCLVSKRSAFMLHPWTGTRKIDISIWVGGVQINAGFTPADIMGWHLYTGTYDGTAVRLYIDGVKVAETAATGTISPDATGMMYIGHDDGYGPTVRNFNGQIAGVQVWSRAQSEVEILANRSPRPSGWESDLVGYWPLDRSAEDLSPNKRHGTLKGAPELLSVGSAFVIGQGFSGELSEVQVWSEARSVSDIRRTMHLQLSGKEKGLELYYRMGAVVYENSPPIVPDFSVHGRNGVVMGDPYAGARRLNRATGSGMKAVKYGSDELLAVSQRGVYEESLEFRVITSDAAFDPNNADGLGNRLFSFSYYGKSTRGSSETVAFPSGSIQQSDFQSLGGGWFKATCRVIVPDGLSLMRAFELSNICGKWTSEALPPDGEWTAIDVRKHRIRLISDAVTRDTYTDQVALAALAGPSQAAIDALSDVERAEGKVARLEEKVVDLLSRIDVAQNNQRYITEKNALTSKLSSLQSQRTTVVNERNAITGNTFSYWQKLRVKHCAMVADMLGETFYATNTDISSRDTQMVRFEPLGSGTYNIYVKGDERGPLVCWEAGNPLITYMGHSSKFDEPLRTILMFGEQWTLIDAGSGWKYIRNTYGFVLDVMGAYTSPNTFIIGYPQNGGDNQKWSLQKSSTLIPSAQAQVDTKNSSIASLDAQITVTQERLDWLNQVLAANESLASLQTQLTSTQTDLGNARTDLGAKNATVLPMIAQISPVAMPTLASDEQDLQTSGALLEFAQPFGGVRLAESCEGNVLLTYMDTRGRLRATVYDATADSRNAAFEQWLPDGIRACADVSDSADLITLAVPVVLPVGGWTCEAWIKYPCATQPNGSPYPMNVLASAANGLDAPLAVRKGRRLGLVLDGWFFDSGAEPSQKLAAGFHHIAVSAGGTTADFFADGVKVGSVKARQPVLRMSGSADYVEVPAHASPTAALTVSAWVRSAGANWNASGAIANKRDAFIMHPVAGGKAIIFYVWVSGLGWRSAQYTMGDIQRWHLYTGTFDGAYIRLYVDGDFVAETAVTGSIQASSGPLYIGRDPGNNSYFAGDIAEVAVFSAARGPSEVRQDSYAPLKGDEGGLLGYWRMEAVDEGGVLKVKDLTSNARHGLVKGAPQDAAISLLRSIDVKYLGNGPNSTTLAASPIGRVAELRIWDLALSDAEVAVHARSATTGNEPGLTAYWPLNEATGITAYDRSCGGSAHGTMSGVAWAGCPANIGASGRKVLHLPERGSPSVICPSVPLSSASFSVECWARRSDAGLNTKQMLLTVGTVNVNNSCMRFGFRETNQFQLTFWNNDLVSSQVYTDTDWHHLCGTYDKVTKTQRLYVDGVLIASRVSTSDFLGTGNLAIGGDASVGTYFTGDIAELRFWNKSLAQTEVQARMHGKLLGTESDLIAYYPMDAVDPANKVQELKSGAFQGQLSGSAQLLLTTSLYRADAHQVVSCEYASIEVASDGSKQAIMRRFYAHPEGKNVVLLPEQRVDALFLQWIGNAQINPTLLGFIEGAPPVPSENLTVEDNYTGATTVTLTQSEETGYTWQRSETKSAAFNLDGFIGAAWAVEGGTPFLSSTISEGQAGGVFNLAFEKSDTKDSTTSATSSLTTVDSLTLTGRLEDSAACLPVGTRWVPKNVGYALVISGMADVYITKLQRSGRMVSYDIRPVEGVPLDVNTITFMINPAYTLNGSLDGMVGSSPADETFYPHVPEMRAQYGSLFPASYFRLKEAYALKEAIDRQDKTRESFFYNFKADQVDKADLTSGNEDLKVGDSNPQASSGDSAADADATVQKSKQEQKENKKLAEKRKAEIEKRQKSMEGRVRAGAAFADWQLRMGNINAKAGKRNIVNTYVWDGDGGLRAEEQSFASTIEHTLSTEIAIGGGLGAALDAAISGVKIELSAVASGGKTDANSKTLSQSKSLELTVDLSGVEGNGITDLRDNPILPGEKVDRYRFMTFYLEGSTNHFNDFFSYVVDPEWLMGNDEEARALRMARSAQPNKCWRVLHRVTYVERPALMAVGSELRTLATDEEDAVTIGFLALNTRMDALDAKLDTKIDQVLSKLP